MTSQTGGKGRAIGRTNVEGKPVANKILLSIPEQDYRSLRPDLEYVVLPHRSTLCEPHQKIEFAYFLNRGMVSLVVAMENGKTVEIGVVGNEGFTGASSAIGLVRSPLREMVQIEAEGFRMKVTRLQAAMRAAPRLQVILSRYAVVQGMQVAQTAACNRLHDLERRFARWLLMTQDRMDSGLLPVTHDFLAAMLGTDRPSVSLVAGAFQKRRIIEYTRGAVRIVSRKKLEKSACECYEVIQRFNGELSVW